MREGFGNQNRAEEAHRVEVIKDLERGPELAHVDELHKVSPEAAQLLGALKEPTLSREAFLAKIDEYNAKHEHLGPDEGSYREFSVAPSLSRDVTVRIYENGLVTLRGWARMEKPH